MENNPKKLPLFTPALFAIGFILLVSAIIFILFQVDRQRKDQVYNRYADETNAYVTQNKENVNKFFTQMYPVGSCVSPYYNSYNSPPIASESGTVQACAYPSAEAIGHTLPQTLKDWSSTMFLKLDGNRLLSMDLSGRVQEFYVYPEDKKTKIITLMRGEVEKIPWDEYTYNLPRKEVIIPVKDDSGKIIGAFMRGVIE